MNEITVIDPKNPSEAFPFLRQPILFASSLQLYGYELLYRGPRQASWHGVDLALLHYLRTGQERTYALFVNLTNDTLLQRDLLDYVPSRQRQITYFELSEEPSNSTCYNAIAARVNDFTEQGLRFALDDFGNGFDGMYRYSVLSQLAIVKLDREFLTAAAKNPAMGRILTMLVREWAAAGTMTIAEGIESFDDFKFARKIGAGFIQGFFVDELHAREGNPQEQAQQLFSSSRA